MSIPRRVAPRTAMRMALLLFLGGAFALRLWRLDAQSLWWDEGISLHLATSSIPALLADRLDNIHPPLYFLLLKGWLALTGVTVFSARYFSVLASWLQVAALYAVARRDLGSGAALLAALLGTISAVSVIYAQEIRVYALLPLLYLALFGVTRRLISSPPDRQDRLGPWLLLVALAWTALHLHYIAIFAVGTAFLWALWVFARDGRRADLRRLLLAGGLLVLASAPWFGAALRNWTAVQNEASAGTFVTEATPWPFLLAQVWAFHLTGLAGALGRPVLSLLVALAAVFFVLLLSWRVAAVATRRKTAVLLALWIGPLGFALLLWQIRSFSHPRYVAMFVPGLLLLCAWLILPARSVRRLLTTLLSGLLLTAVIASAVAGLWTYFNDAEAAKDDVRSAARYLAQRAAPGDLILVPDTDWSLPFEYDGAARVAMPGWDEERGGWERLAALTANAPRVFTLDYARGTRDWQARLPYALQAAGTLLGQEQFPGVIVRSYRLGQPVSAPAPAPASADFGPLRLTGAALPRDESAGALVPVALQWQAVDPAALEQTQVALRLLDEDGRALATADDLLRDEDGRPAGQWSPGQTVTTYHLLDVPRGVPPLAYEVGVQLYEVDGAALRSLELRDAAGAPQGREARLPGLLLDGPVRQEGDAGPAPLPLLPQPLSLGDNVQLLGYTVAGDAAAIGQPLGVELLWSVRDSQPDLRPELALVQNGRDLAVAAVAPVNGRYPVSRWSPGEWVWERRLLPLPPGSSGPAELRLRLGPHDVLLDEVRLQSGPQQMSAPAGFAPLAAQFGSVARLAGYDVPKTAVVAGTNLPLRLLWQAEAEAGQGDYAVFVQLLAEDGRLIAQHDGIPAAGTRPTAGWIPGEYIIDPHELAFRDADYSGPARLIAGLYDPQTGQRLLLPDGRDHIVLPPQLVVEPAS